MNNKLFILLLFFTLTPILSFAQLEQIWEQKYGGKRSDFIHSIIENHDGEYVFVGQSGNLGNDGKQSGDLEKLTGGNEDVFFGILRKDGTSKFLKAIGRNKKESAFDVVQTYEGGYAVVGFSNSKTKKSIGKKDGWLMLLDHEGRFIWETRVGTTEDDEIKAIYQLTNGNLAVTGQTNKKLWVGCYDLQGNEVWTKESDAGRTGAIGNDIMQTDDASIIIIGTSFYNSKSKIVLWKLDENGKELVKPAEYGKDYDTGLRIAQYDDEIFCLSGFWSTGGKNDPDLFPISKNLKPKVEDDRLYEKRNDDTPKAFLKSSLNKHFFLTGGSLSHSSKAKRDKVFVIHTEESGKPLNEDWEFFGGNFTDAAYDIIETFDGDILLAGNTFSHRKLGDNSDGWVIKLKGPEFPKTGEKANIKLENIAFVEPSKDDILQPAERGYIVFDLVNDSKTPAYQISGKVTITNEKNLIFPREIKYGHLPANSRKRYSLPIAGDFDLENGTSDVKMVFSERNGAAIPTLQETINYKLRPEVKLLVSKPEWNFSGEKIKAEQPVTLKVKITNKGDLTATNVRAEFNYERNIEAQSEKNLKHGDLAPGATADFEFTFAANRVFKGDSARIGFRYFANEGEYEFGVQERYSAQFEREILLPVLAISNPTFSPQKEVYDPEAEITINFDVENKGNVDLTNFKGNFTSDFPIDFSGKTTVAIENLKIKSKQPVSIKFKPKKGFTREQLNVRFAYTAEQSPYNQEQSEDYNFKFMKLEPSLAISSFQLSTASQPLKRNQPTEIVFTITNDGRGDAEKIIVGVKPQTGVKLLSKQKASIEKLKAGESETRTFKVLIDEAFASESAQVIGFYESSIGNDEKTLNFNVEGAAPLVAIKDFKLSTSAPLSPGKEATILFTVKNEGGQPTEKIDWKISPSTNILAEKTSGAINSIAPGAEEKVELTFTVDEANTKDFITAILSIQHQSKNHPQSDKKSIKEKALKQPGKLEFAGYEIVGGKTKISRGETIELNAKVTNTGASDLEANTFDVSSSDGISILSNKNITVNNLKSKTSESIEIKFEVPEDFAGESFSINLKGGSISEKFDFDLGPVPTFALPEIATLNFDKTEIFRDETTNLTIDISNKGTGAANDLKIELKFSETPSNVSENSITITSVAPGKSNSKQISITPGNKVTGEELDVNISMSGGDLENPIRKKITLKIKDKPVGLAASEFEFTSSLNEQKIDLQTGIDREDIISFTAVIENTGGQTIENPEIKLTMPDGIQKMFENTRNAIVIAPGNTFEYQISFNVTEKFTGEKADFTFACKTGSINETKSFSIPIKSLPPAIAFNPSLPNGVLEREKGYKISTTVSNNGGSPLKNAVATWSAVNEGIETVSDLKINIGNIGVGESKPVPLDFILPKDYLGAVAEFKIKLTGDHPDFKNGVEETYQTEVKEVIRKEKFALSFRWLSPEPMSKIKKTMKVRVDVTSNRQLDPKKFKLFNNGKLFQTGGKFGEEPLIAPSGSSFGDMKIHRYDFVKEINLSEGPNKLELGYELKDGSFAKSEVNEINYFAKQVNVFAFAIGINDYDDENISDLKYAANDAKDFVDAYKKREGKLFGKVAAQASTTPRSTRKQGILGSVSRIKKLVDDDAIGEDDIIILFYSGHGKTIDNRFYLVPSDYETVPTDEESIFFDAESTLVDFEKEIMRQHLNKIANRNIFVFIDACHSGTSTAFNDDYNLGKDIENTAVSKILGDLMNKTRRGIVTMNSCMPDQLSWEHPEEQNGIFTSAIISAFDNAAVPVNGASGTVRADENGDKALTFGEFFSFLQKRVPYLAKNIKQEQTPFLPQKAMEMKDFNFFLVE